MNFLKQHGIGDYLNHIFTIFPKIWKSALPVAALIYLPAGLSYVMGFTSLGSVMENITHLSGQDPSNISATLLPLFGVYAWFILASIFFAFGNALTTALVSDQAIALIKSEQLDGGALRRALSHNALTIVGQGLIVGCLLMVIMTVALGLMAVLGILAFGQNLSSMGSNRMGLAFTGLMFLGFFIMMPVVYWLITKTSVAPQVIIAEKSGAFVGIGRSFHLVRGSSWRVFGVTFVVNLVIGFALGILTGPIIFIFVLPGYMQFLQNMLSGTGYSIDSTVQLFKSMAWGLGISYYIQAIALGLLLPIFKSLLYTDLRIRRNEWLERIELPPQVTITESNNA